MLRLPSLGELDQGLRVRVYLCTSPTDMRKRFDTLAVLVRDSRGYDPLSGHLFLFVGRRRDRLKILYWDRDGYASLLCGYRVAQVTNVCRSAESRGGQPSATKKR